MYLPLVAQIALLSSSRLVLKLGLQVPVGVLWRVHVKGTSLVLRVD